MDFLRELGRLFCVDVQDFGCLLGMLAGMGSVEVLAEDVFGLLGILTLKAERQPPNRGHLGGAFADRRLRR